MFWYSAQVVLIETTSEVLFLLHVLSFWASYYVTSCIFILEQH